MERAGALGQVYGAPAHLGLSGLEVVVLGRRWWHTARVGHKPRSWHRPLLITRRGVSPALSKQLWIIMIFFFNLLGFLFVLFFFLMHCALIKKFYYCFINKCIKE